MAPLLTFLLPALAPALTDAVRAIVGKISGTPVAAPKTPADTIALMAAETAKLEALARLDAPIGTPSQWIIDVRAIFRYAAVTLIWIISGLVIYENPAAPIALIMLDLCGATLSFIIGERFYLKITGK